MEAYQVRMLKEYTELKERYEKLVSLLDRWERKELDFTPACPYSLLRDQARVMAEYLGILEERARIEQVELPL